MQFLCSYRKAHLQGESCTHLSLWELLNHAHLNAITMLDTKEPYRYRGTLFQQQSNVATDLDNACPGYNRDQTDQFSETVSIACSSLQGVAGPGHIIGDLSGRSSRDESRGKMFRFNLPYEIEEICNSWGRPQSVTVTKKTKRPSIRKNSQESFVAIGTQAHARDSHPHKRLGPVLY